MHILSDTLFPLKTPHVASLSPCGFFTGLYLMLFGALILFLVTFFLSLAGASWAKSVRHFNSMIHAFILFALLWGEANTNSRCRNAAKWLLWCLDSILSPATYSSLTHREALGDFTMGQQIPVEMCCVCVCVCVDFKILLLPLYRVSVRIKGVS